MKRTVLHALLVVVCTLAVFVLPALSDSQVRIVRLSYLNGSAQIDRDSGQGFERAIMNMPVTQGTRLKTGDGQAEVEFENGSTVRIAPETQLFFDGLSLIDNGTKVSSMTLDQGVAYFDLNHKNGNDFRLQFAGRNIEVKKSAHFRVDIGRDQVRLAVFNGEVAFAGPDKRITVHKNETFSFDPANLAQYALAKGIDEYQFDSWDHQREQYQDQYTRVSYTRGAPSYGWSDLNYYGSFGYYPGYGNLWRPFGVGYGWDPFTLGYWVWYPTWGYTWVSPYAWGWTPYRYGGWSYVPGYGWGWRPGPWRGWNPVTPVHNPPPTWNPPHPPSAPGHSLVPIGHPRPVPMVPAFTPFADGPNRPGNRSAVKPLPTPNVMPGGVSGGAIGRFSDRGNASPLPSFGKAPAGLQTVPSSRIVDGPRNAPSQSGGRVFTPPPPTSPTAPPSHRGSVGRGNAGDMGGTVRGNSGGVGRGAPAGGTGVRTGGSPMGGGAGRSGGMPAGGGPVRGGGTAGSTGRSPR